MDGLVDWESPFSHVYNYKIMENIYTWGEIIWRGRGRKTGSTFLRSHENYNLLQNILLSEGWSLESLDSVEIDLECRRRLRENDIPCLKNIIEIDVVDRIKVLEKSNSEIDPIKWQKTNFFKISIRSKFNSNLDWHDNFKVVIYF